MHYPTTCRIPSQPGSPEALHSTTTRISEPPGIEGFLIRHRPNGTPERIYLSSRMGMLFLCRASTAHPPDPPMNVYDALNNPAAVVLAPFVFGMASLAAPNKKKRERLWNRVSRGAVVKGKAHKHQRRRDWTLKSMTAADAADEVFGNADLDCNGGEVDAAQCDGNDMLEWLDRQERERAFLQITDARGFVDLSDLESVEPDLEDDARDRFVQVHDAGGQEGLNLADDKAKLRRLRSFIVKTRSGMTSRFEVRHFLPSQLTTPALTRPLFHAVSLDRRSRRVGRPPPRSRNLLASSRASRRDPAHGPLARRRPRQQAPAALDEAKVCVEQGLGRRRRAAADAQRDLVEPATRALLQLVPARRLPRHHAQGRHARQEGLARHVPPATRRAPPGRSPRVRRPALFRGSSASGGLVGGYVAQEDTRADVPLFFSKGTNPSRATSKDGHSQRHIIAADTSSPSATATSTAARSRHTCSPRALARRRGTRPTSRRTSCRATTRRRTGSASRTTSRTAPLSSCGSNTRAAAKRTSSTRARAMRGCTVRGPRCGSACFL